MQPDYFDPKTYPEESYFLQPGTVVDAYMVEKPLAGGGFSSVYLARQRSDQLQVVIKEYLPRRLAHRTWQNQIVPNSEKTRLQFLRGKTLIFEEAKVLSQLKHHNIVEVLNFFHANSTIYLVMTFEYGKSLSSFIQKQQGKLEERFILAVFPALLEGIQVIHDAHLVHLDVKPDNILIRPADDPLLLDFGAVHPFPRRENRKPGNVLTKGFSPPEQYEPDGNIGPWSDIYATGATMRSCIDGLAPPPAPERCERDTLEPARVAFRKKYSGALLETIDASLELDPANRPQSIAEIMSRLANA